MVYPSFQMLMCLLLVCYCRTHSHTCFYRGLYYNALDISRHPERVNTHGILLNFKLKPPHRGAPRYERFDIESAHVISMEEAVDFLGSKPDAADTVNIMAQRDKELKEAGRLGIGWVVMAVNSKPRLLSHLHMRLSDRQDARQNTIGNFWGGNTVRIYSMKISFFLN